MNFAMFQKIQTIQEMRRIFQSGQNIGDVPVLKLTLFSKHEAESPFSAEILKRRAENFSRLDPEALAALPADTFGHAYSRFMSKFKLTPFNFSARVHELFDRYPVGIRYVRLHDMIHVLLDFDADLVGEIGVYAFVGEQNYNPTLNRAALAARVFGALLFWKREQIQAARARGKQLGAEAKPLITQPLEDMLEMPLDDARRALGISAHHPGLKT